MKSFLKNCKKTIATVLLVVTVAAIGTSQATIVPLVTAADFAVPGGSAVTNADAPTLIIGDVVSSSTSSVMGLTFANVDGILYLTADTTTPADATVFLINRASANNVLFWQVRSFLTFGVNSAFAGNVIANNSITLKANRGVDI
jgi:hypothetical protein